MIHFKRGDSQAIYDELRKCLSHNVHRASDTFSRKVLSIGIKNPI